MVWRYVLELHVGLGPLGVFLVTNYYSQLNRSGENCEKL